VLSPHLAVAEGEVARLESYPDVDNCQISFDPAKCDVDVQPGDDVSPLTCNTAPCAVPLDYDVKAVSEESIDWFPLKTRVSDHFDMEKHMLSRTLVFTTPENAAVNIQVRISKTGNLTLLDNQFTVPGCLSKTTVQPNQMAQAVFDAAAKDPTKGAAIVGQTNDHNTFNVTGVPPGSTVTLYIRYMVSVPEPTPACRSHDNKSYIHYDWLFFGPTVAACASDAYTFCVEGPVDGEIVLPDTEVAKYSTKQGFSEGFEQHTHIHMVPDGTSNKSSISFPHGPGGNIAMHVRVRQEDDIAVISNMSKLSMESAKLTANVVRQLYLPKTNTLVKQWKVTLPLAAKQRQNVIVRLCVDLSYSMEAAMPNQRKNRTLAVELTKATVLTLHESVLYLQKHEMLGSALLEIVCFSDDERRLGVVDFSDRVEVEQLVQKMEEVERAGFSGGTSFLPWLQYIAKTKPAHQGYKKVVVCMTDGGCNSFNCNRLEALAREIKKDGSIAMIGVGRWVNEHVAKLVADRGMVKMYPSPSMEYKGEVFETVLECFCAATQNPVLFLQGPQTLLSVQPTNGDEISFGVEMHGLDSVQTVTGLRPGDSAYLYTTGSRSNDETPQLLFLGAMTDANRVQVTSTESTVGSGVHVGLAMLAGLCEVHKVRSTFYANVEKFRRERVIEDISVQLQIASSQAKLVTVWLADNGEDLTNVDKPYPCISSMTSNDRVVLHPTRLFFARRVMHGGHAAEDGDYPASTMHGVHYRSMGDDDGSGAPTLRSLCDDYGSDVPAFRGLCDDDGPPDVLMDGDPREVPMADGVVTIDAWKRRPCPFKSVSSPAEVSDALRAILDRFDSADQPASNQAGKRKERGSSATTLNVKKMVKSAMQQCTKQGDGALVGDSRDPVERAAFESDRAFTLAFLNLLRMRFFTLCENISSCDGSDESIVKTSRSLMKTIFKGS